MSTGASAVRDDLVALDRQHLVHPNMPVGATAPVVFERGEGVYLFDVDGRRYLDARSQLNCVNLGYRHPALDAAISAQLEQVAYVSLFYGFTHPQAVTAAARIAELAPGDLNRVAFTSGGSEAIEQALALVRLYWSNRDPARTTVISRLRGYHGNTAGAMSATGMPMGGLPGLPDIVPGHVRIAPPYPFRDGADARQAADVLAAAIEAEPPGTVAAFLAEPVIGVGGYLAPPEGYWPLVREVCDAHDVLLIADEVMTGFRRTGPMFGCDIWDLVPDLLVMGKGINGSYVPCGGVVIGGRVEEVLDGVVLSGFTHGGHPLAMAAANAALDVYSDPAFVAHVDGVTTHIRTRLEGEHLELPGVADIDGLGLMIGIELDFAEDRTGRIVELALERGLIVRGRDNRLSFSPPLVISRDEADEALDLLHGVLADVGRAG
jgi:putrescine aminotransferase